MLATASIKGSIFASVIEDVNKLVARGALAQRELSRWLRADDIELLGAAIVVSNWYDIRSYARLNELLLAVEGGGDPQYLRQRGRQTARKLLEAGLYAQLEYLQRAEVRRTTGEQARFAAFGRDLRLLTTISASILSFSRWMPKPDTEQANRYVIEVCEARDFPEVLAWRSDGFVNEMATQHGEPDLWSWARVAPDLIVFRMIRSL